MANAVFIALLLVDLLLVLAGLLWLSQKRASQDITDMRNRDRRRIVR